MVAPPTEAWSGNPLPSVDLSIRPSLHQILEQPEQFFHMSQQSAKVSCFFFRSSLFYLVFHYLFLFEMCIEHSRRTLLSNELKRRADIQHYREYTMKPTTLRQDPVIRVSGRVGDEQLLLQACERLRDLLFVPEVADKISFSTHMEVPAAQRSQLVGTPDGAQLLVISRVTKALLHFPSHSDEASQTLFFYFTGQPESILKARRYVQGLLPMQLCFHAGSEDLRARIDPENRLIKFYDEVLRVSVRVVPSDLESLSMLPGDQMRHFISLRTSEYNVGALYAVMRRVLKHGDEIPMVKPTDYAEMLPLVPDLIKHACEVNVK
ncbi:hypothetical protein ANCDUO_06096 [Ancylostoma duodenale]|uniref:Defective in germ line development protein 3-like KH5 domain-containing protein n=1 Tax=Ancylostoma duodenale TaxID=51022 RepID=A0A0C2H2E7_9BILA|nr:hypothetical protein ANCDUO_06096 [Ancylostoma duodenale]